MSNQPITPKAHGLIDYGFAALQWLAPELLGFDNKIIKLYKVLGLNLLAYNSVTDHPVAAKPLISYHTHHQIDTANVAMLALLTAYKGIRKNKRVLAFHVGFVALGAINVLLTDWKAGSDK
jgi:hypothetical protein